MVGALVIEDALLAAQRMCTAPKHRSYHRSSFAWLAGSTEYVHSGSADRWTLASLLVQCWQHSECAQQNVDGVGKHDVLAAQRMCTACATNSAVWHGLIGGVLAVQRMYTAATDGSCFCGLLAAQGMCTAEARLNVAKHRLQRHQGLCVRRARLHRRLLGSTEYVHSSHYPLFV